MLPIENTCTLNPQITNFCYQSHRILGERSNLPGKKFFLHSDTSSRKPLIHLEPELSFLTSLHVLFSCTFTWPSLHTCFPPEFTSSLRAEPVSLCFTSCLSAWHIVGASLIIKARRNMKAALSGPGDPMQGAAVVQSLSQAQHTLA